MNTSDKILWPILIILLITVFILKIENDRLQQNIDNVYITAIGNCIDGLSRDYDLVNDIEKTQLYYSSLYNLETAIDVFNQTTYKENNDLFFSLNNLHTYLYLRQNPNDNFEIKNRSSIYDFLTNIIADSKYNPKINEFDSLE
jgi:hypothetical protein